MEGGQGLHGISRTGIHLTLPACQYMVNKIMFGGFGAYKPNYSVFKPNRTLVYIGNTLGLFVLTLVFWLTYMLPKCGP